MKSCPSRSATMGTKSCPAAIVLESMLAPVDGDVGPDQLPTELGREFRSGESHASPSRPIV